MILTRKSKIISLSFFSVLVSVSIASYSYVIIVNALSYTPEKLKFIGENIFFIGIVCAIFFGFSGAYILHKSFKFNKALDKLVVMSRNTGYSPDIALRKLGKTGEQIADILTSLNEIGEARALKISALENLCRILLEKSNKLSAVISISGEILYSSEKLALKLETSQGELIGQQSDAFISSTDLEQAVSSKKETVIEHGTIYPVMNKKSDTVFCFCIFAQSLSNIIPDTVKTNTTVQEKMRKINIFSAIKRKKSKKI